MPKIRFVALVAAAAALALPGAASAGTASTPPATRGEGSARHGSFEVTAP